MNIIINYSTFALSLMVYVFFLLFFFHYRFAITIPHFGIFMNLQHFGSNIFLFQVIFGALTISVRCLALYPLNNVGRRPTEIFFLFLVGLSILINMFVPQGERRLEFGERKCLFRFVISFYRVSSATLTSNPLRAASSLNFIFFIPYFSLK